MNVDLINADQTREIQIDRYVVYDFILYLKLAIFILLLFIALTLLHSLILGLTELRHCWHFTFNK